ncbi:MAG: GNAT family acetyltransferase [Fretibacterium sp.]|nr:GNAT family acetyltransferase [Fretibacterium sp.]
MRLAATNILDFLEGDGEDFLKEFLASFSCGVNLEIESFLRERAIDFAKRRLSITYLVRDTDDGEFLGYFTLTHKAVILDGKGFSKTMQRKLTRYSRLDKQTGNYMASAFLLAQFGKNYGVDDGKRISGAELMGLVNDVLVNVQRQIGGGIVYLDCEDKAKLIAFYENEGFKRFDERFSEEDNQRYIQLMRFL